MTFLYDYGDEWTSGASALKLLDRAGAARSQLPEDRQQDRQGFPAGHRQRVTTHCAASTGWVITDSSAWTWVDSSTPPRIRSLLTI